ncbi:TonB-dependent receptor [Sphingomonas lenta]|uniref:TonB-dependent receptor n=1 Tax=Sphingomonas lenta TaxID=1141887 RepID=A0A2A2SJ82_9SPHN|nr:TonB-dependent receptor [Sphingomonas lenta]PAX09278.1 TonB-dependent receptor [Sphingomonas lenta]
MLKPQFLAATAASALALAVAAPAAAQTNPPAPGGQEQPGDANTTPPPGTTSASGQEQSDQGSISGPNDPQGTPEETMSTGDIVVTAQGRAQALADVPVAVSVVNAANLERTGATDIRQITQVAPSLLVSSTGNEANGSARLRGIGTVGDNPGLESSVAVFVDGVYRSRSGVGLNELGDIERVEVLRGPQGTLFGRNASAGIISIVSKAPDLNRLSGGVQAEYGNYDYYRLAGNINVPLGDTLAGRIDAVYVKRDGFLYDVTNDRRVNDRDRLFARGQLLFQPDDALTVRLIADYTKREEACCGAVYINGSVAPANRNLTNPALNPIVRVLQDLDPQRYGQQPFTDPFSRRIYVNQGRSYDGETEDYGFSGQIDYDFGFGTLTSITGYRVYDNFQGSDTDYGPVDILYRAANENGGARRFETFSQELRLQGTAFDDRLDWLVGAYYANEDLTVKDNLRFGTQYGRFATCRLVQAFGFPGSFYAPGAAACLSPTGRAVLSNQVPGVPSPFGAGGAAIVGAFDRLATVNDRGTTTDRYEQNSENYAFFTHNIFEITEGLNFTIGARYTREVKTFDALFGNDNTACPAQQAALRPFLGTPLAAAATGLINLACQGNSTSELNGVAISDRRKESEFTGTAILSYKITPDLLVYGSVARGYKAGGFNLDRSALKAPVEGVGTASVRTTFADFGGAQALVGRLQFDEEINTAFEVGAKYSTGSFSLNVAAFRQEFDNFQLNTFNGSVFLVQNVNSCGTDLNGADRDTAPFVPNAAATGACDPDEVRPGVISQGFEVEASLSPVRNVTVNAGLTYADTFFRNDLVGGESGAPLDPALLRLPGDNLSNAPEIVTTTSLTWTPPLGDTGLSGLFYVDQRTTSDYNTGSDLFPQKEQDGFTLVNARIGIRGPDSRWSIEAWAQNLFDVDYTQVAFNSPFQAVGTGPVAPTSPLAGTFPLAQYPGGTQIFSAFLAEPRTYGLTGRFRF